MIVVVQRVREASVRVGGEVVGAIDHGLCLLACGMRDDQPDELDWLGDKLCDLRLFADEAGLTNRSLLDVGGAALVVSQFTLAADWRKGRRPSFGGAAPPEDGARLLEHLVRRLRARGVSVAEGRFGAMMAVSLVNDGPFTLVLDSREAPGRRAGAAP